jgi:phosphoribosylformylglycinamidine (FGAM) synthase PurS component
MTIDQINEQIAKRETLTEQELNELRDAILANPIAKDITIRGALTLNDFNFAARLALAK